MRRALAAVTLAALVVVAGCGSTTSDGTTSSTADTSTRETRATAATSASTRTANTTDRTANTTDRTANTTTRAGESDLPSWLGREPNASALLERHLASAANTTGYRRVYARTYRLENGTVRERGVVAVNASAERLRRHRVREESGNATEHSYTYDEALFHAANTTYARRVTGDGVTYAVTDVNDGREGWGYVLRRYAGIEYDAEVLGVWNWTYRGQRDGSYVFTATDIDPGRNGTAARTLRNATNRSARLVVGPDGMLRVFAFSFAATNRGRRVHATFEVRFEDVGRTRVSAPDWLDEARNASTTTTAA